MATDGMVEEAQPFRVTLTVPDHNLEKNDDFRIEDAFDYNGDFTVQKYSPCAPPGVTDCGLVGALGVGCGPVAVEALSWAKIKEQYR